MYDWLFGCVWWGGGLTRVITYDVFQTLVCYGINVLWFIITLFLAKMILYWILRIKKNGIIKLLILCAIGIGVVIFMSVLAVALESTRLKNPIMWTAIGILRPLLAIYFVYTGFILYPVFCKEIVQKENSIHRALFSSLLILIVLIPTVFKMKITMVNMISEPVWMIMISGVISSIGMISASLVIKQNAFLKKVLMFFGRNSLIIMLTHEYLQIRSSIQDICENIIDNRAVVLFMTFICVVATETIICLLWTNCKNRVRTKRRLF